MKTKIRIWVCDKNQLGEGDYRRVEVAYAGEPSSVLVFHFKGEYLAYRNLCVHMSRTLDCEKDMIFDGTGQYLRCSMHGIIFDPVTGESKSVICQGDKLTQVQLLDGEDGLWIFDNKVKPLAETIG